MTIRKDIKGFSHIEGILLLIIVGLIAFSGYLVLDRQKDTNSNETEAADKASQPISQGEDDKQEAAIARSIKAPYITYRLPPSWSVERTDLFDQSTYELTGFNGSGQSFVVVDGKLNGNLDGIEGRQILPSKRSIDGYDIYWVSSLDGSGGQDDGDRFTAGAIIVALGQDRVVESSLLYDTTYGEFQNSKYEQDIETIIDDLQLIFQE